MNLFYKTLDIVLSAVVIAIGFNLVVGLFSSTLRACRQLGNGKRPRPKLVKTIKADELDEKTRRYIERIINSIDNEDDEEDEI